MNKKVLFVTQAAAIAALYVILTLVANAFGLANHAIQVRFSEALTILPFFTAAAIPGLFLGCFLSNLITGCMVLDMVFGSLATLAGALLTFFICKAMKHNRASEFIAPIPPILANTLVVPFVLAYVYELEGSVPYFMLTVGAGEIISCGILGILFLNGVKKSGIFKREA